MGAAVFYEWLEGKHKQRGKKGQKFDLGQRK